MKDTGISIMSASKVLRVIAIIGTIIVGMIVMALDKEGNSVPLVFGIIIGGIVISAVFGWLMHAFGELIVAVHDIKCKLPQEDTKISHTPEPQTIAEMIALHKQNVEQAALQLLNALALQCKRGEITEEEYMAAKKEILGK